MRIYTVIIHVVFLLYFGCGDLANVQEVLLKSFSEIIPVVLTFIVSPLEPDCAMHVESVLRPSMHYSIYFTKLSFCHMFCQSGHVQVVYSAPAGRDG